MREKAEDEGKGDKIEIGKEERGRGSGGERRERM